MQLLIIFIQKKKKLSQRALYKIIEGIPNASSEVPVSVRVNGDDHKTLLLSNCMKSSTVQKLNAASSGIMYELWYENSTRRC